MNKREQRINKIAALFKAYGYVSIHDLSEQLGVSEMTVRRDLKAMEENFTIQESNAILPGATHGVIPNNQEYTILRAFHQQSSEKAAIGIYAASLVRQDDILILDTGTTTEYIVRALSPNLNLTVLTSGQNILTKLQLNSNIKILFAGGQYHPETQLFECEEGIQFIRRQRAYKVFLSAAGIHGDLGITCANNYEVPTKQAIMRSAVEKILVADAQKFGTVHPAHFCDLKDIDSIISDDSLSKEWQERIFALGISLHLVKASG